MNHHSNSANASSNTTVNEEHILRLSQLEHDRDAKRMAIELNFEERSMIRMELVKLTSRQEILTNEKIKLEQELQELDAQILNLEHIVMEQPEPQTLNGTQPETQTPRNQLHHSSAQMEHSHLNNNSHLLECTLQQDNNTLHEHCFAVKEETTQQTPTTRPFTVTGLAFGSNTNTLPSSESFKPKTSLQCQKLEITQQEQQNPWIHQIQHVLKHTFHIKAFRDHQEQVILATLAQKDVFCIMRTGGGKSLTYQLPAILEGTKPCRKLTLVVSPLLSLIQDQQEQMNQFCRNSAISFTSANTSDHAQQWTRVRHPDSGLRMILVTPERVSKSTRLMRELEQLHTKGRLGRFVIDEAHCATQWGHDFRPDYALLGKLKQAFPTVPLLALTATASDQVRKDVCRILGLRPDHLFFRSSANRTNLQYSVRCKPDQKDKIIEQMAQFIQEKHHKQAGIIYTFSRKEAEYVAKSLKDYNITAAPYHSSISAAAKSKLHTSWMQNKTQVVVATIAFGLGINKPDVRFVLHHSISKTLEAYYQESGRAGRDGGPADCVLWYAPKDVIKMLGMIAGTCAERSSFWPMTRYGQAHGNDAVCRAILMSKLGEPNCLDPAEVHRQNEGLTSICRNVSEHVRTLLKLMQAKAKEKLTLTMLVKEWRSKSSKLSCLVDNPPHKDLSVDECERIIVMLLVEEVLNPRVVPNKFSTCVYIEMGPNVNKMVASKELSVSIHLPKLDHAPSPTNPNAVLKQKTKITTSNNNSNTVTSSSSSSSLSSIRKTRSKRKLDENSLNPINTLVSKKPHLIDLAVSDDDDALLPAKKVARSKRGALKQTTDSLWDDESSSEYEFNDNF